ncbi:hypothetical protein LARI1_G006638 [Lachnellula arida]|uniref:Uncharacterized protein n=1 Tax=Lachnellula arida TaxID=1316785 RepID=A0A8T9B4E4_9HELO|nr:hypothetical protein LARI1_G006638 [Lachnellula arida]
MSQPLTRSAIEAVISKYGPVLQIHPYETYNLCSVEWFLSHCTLIDSKNPFHNIVHPTQTQLPHTPKEGTRYYLNIEEAVKPGDFSTAKAYVNAFWAPGQTYTDLQFWFFSGYNGHGTALFSSLLLNKPAHTGTIDLSPLGEHVGDWEYAAIRIDNTTQDMIGIMLSAHGKNIFYDKAAVEEQFKLTKGTAIHMDAKTLGNFLVAALGEKKADPLLDTPVVLAASWLLHVFVTADINGAGAPSGQGPWSGHY